LARKGATPSQIGVVLRDSHGVAQVKIATGVYTKTSFCEMLVGYVKAGTERDKKSDTKKMFYERLMANYESSRLGNKILRILKSQGTII